MKAYLLTCRSQVFSLACIWFVSAMMVSFLESDHSKEKMTLSKSSSLIRDVLGPSASVYEQRPGKCEL